MSFSLFSRVPSRSRATSRIRFPIEVPSFLTGYFRFIISKAKNKGKIELPSCAGRPACATLNLRFFTDTKEAHPMAQRPYPVITVNEKAARSLRGGHPWVYGAETTGPDRPCENGDLVDVVTQKGRWLGTGFL
ncbi:MAG: hypothetical protein SPE50_09360, partial [Evtepia sp.]|nr:hypothetical protein [Evtepia sp.]